MEVFYCMLFLLRKYVILRLFNPLHKQVQCGIKGIWLCLNWQYAFFECSNLNARHHLNSNAEIEYRSKSEIIIVLTIINSQFWILDHWLLVCICNYRYPHSSSAHREAWPRQQQLSKTFSSSSNGFESKWETEFRILCITSNHSVAPRKQHGTYFCTCTRSID